MENLVHQMNNKFSPQFMKTKTGVSFLLFIVFAPSILANQTEVITIQKMGADHGLQSPTASHSSLTVLQMQET
jgi:hypothetical protein